MGLYIGDIHWVDTKTRTLTKKPVPKLPEPDSFPWDHYFVPGQNKMVLITGPVSPKNGYLVSVASYDAHGNFKLEPGGRRIPQTAGSLLVTRDNRLVITGDHVSNEIRIGPLVG